MYSLQQTSLTRERHQCDSLRTERDSLYSELHNARSMAAQHSTGTILLQSRISLLERAAKNREAEIEEWRLRFSEAQQKAVEEQVRKRNVGSSKAAVELRQR